MYLALVTGQMNTLQDKPVVHLHSHQDSIPVEFGGDLLVLANGPAIVHLPYLLPRLDSQRKPWSIYVQNLGPNMVRVVGKSEFSVDVNIGRTVEIKSDGRAYTSAH